MLLLVSEQFYLVLFFNLNTTRCPGLKELYSLVRNSALCPRKGFKHMPDLTVFFTPLETANDYLSVTKAA
jgi:hypothetical protein